MQWYSSFMLLGFLMGKEIYILKELGVLKFNYYGSVNLDGNPQFKVPPFFWLCYCPTFTTKKIQK